MLIFYPIKKHGQTKGKFRKSRQNSGNVLRIGSNDDGDDDIVVREDGEDVKVLKIMMKMVIVTMKTLMITMKLLMIMKEVMVIIESVDDNDEDCDYHTESIDEDGGDPQRWLMASYDLRWRNILLMWTHDSQE